MIQLDNQVNVVVNGERRVLSEEARRFAHDFIERFSDVEAYPADEPLVTEILEFMRRV